MMQTRRMILGMALVLSVAAAWWVARDRNADVVQERTDAMVMPASRARLEGAQPVPFARNLLAALERPRMELDPRGTPFAVPPPPPAAPVPQPEAVPPAFPYVYAGRIDVPGEPPRFVLARGADLLTVREGEAIDADFVLKVMHDSGVEVETLPDRRNWTLPFAGSAQPPGTGMHEAGRSVVGSAGTMAPALPEPRAATGGAAIQQRTAVADAGDDSAAMPPSRTMENAPQAMMPMQPAPQPRTGAKAN